MRVVKLIILFNPNTMRDTYPWWQTVKDIEEAPVIRFLWDTTKEVATVNLIAPKVLAELQNNL